MTAKARFACWALVCIPAAPAFAQDAIPYVYPNQEVRVANLPSPTASSTGASVPLATALEIIVDDRAVCCGKDSALESVVYSHPRSLKELGARLQGQHVMSDGRRVLVSAEYVPQISITSDLMISELMQQHAPLIEWKGRSYVLYGAVFDKTVYSNGRQQFAIRKLLLRDPRFSDERSYVEFNRETDDWGKIQELLTLAVSRQ